MSAAPPALTRFCRLKQHPRKLALYNTEYGSKCRDFALGKLTNYSVVKAKKLLLAAKGHKKIVDGVTPEDEVNKKKGYVSRNQAAATLELSALQSAVRKHINTKVTGKTANHSRQRPAPGAADRAASGQSAG